MKHSQNARKLAAALALLLLIASSALTAAPISAQGGSGNYLIASVAEAAIGGDAFWTPWDATPDPDGTMVYFTATSPQGPGVFAVPAGGGDAVPLAVGAPFVAPLGLAISTDGQTLYVADSWGAGVFGNAILALPVGGGTPVAVAGSVGTQPQGVEVIRQGEADMLYFSGVNPATGQPAILSLPATGAEAATVLYSGAPLVAPSGVAVSADGTVYTVDRLAVGHGLGSVFRISDGMAELVADGILAGSPLAGIALAGDESLLFVSALDREAHTSQALVLFLQSGDSAVVDAVISTNMASGGLHRAHNNPGIFAWADGTIGPIRGRVYTLTAAGS